MCKGCFDSLLYREVVGLVFVTAMLLFAILVWVCMLQVLFDWFLYKDWGRRVFLLLDDAKKEKTFA